MVYNKDMKKILVGIGGLGIIGVGYWLLSPLWRTEVVNEALPDQIVAQDIPQNTSSNDGVSTSPTVSAPLELYAGSFVGFDRLHQGAGTAKIIEGSGKTYVRFESDFTVSNGPDLFVGFGKDGHYDARSEVGALKGNVGAQNYELPAGFESERYNEVYVWCRAFSVPFAKARLTKL